MGRKSPKPPKEDDSVIAARERQILDLAKLDEEENRRVKQMRQVSRGVRAFRAIRGAKGVGGSSTTGSVGSSSVRADNGASVVSQALRAMQPR